MNKDYVARINRVIDYIEEHLSDPLTLDELADVAHFSPYHFHRIFKASMNEPLGKFIQRLRLNWAAGKLITERDLPITTIAHDAGFSSSASFAHSFKQQWGMSAREWRESNLGGGKIDQELRKNPHMRGNPSEEWSVTVHYASGVPYVQQWRVAMKTQGGLTAEVEIRDIEPMPVVYVRHVGPYAGDSKLFERLFGKLYSWAGPRNLIGPKTRVMSIYHDSPEITEEDKLRVSCCITVPEGTKGEGEVGTMTVPGGRYAVAHFVLDPAQYGEAWQAVFGGWLPESGYLPDDRPAFELYLGDMNAQPGDKHDVEIWVPVKPA